MQSNYLWKADATPPFPALLYTKHMGARDLGFIGARLLAVYFAYAGLSDADRLSSLLNVLRSVTADMPELALGYWLLLARIPLFIGLGAGLWLQSDYLSGLVARGVERSDHAQEVPYGVAAGCAALAGWLIVAMSGWSILDTMGQPDRQHYPWLDAAGSTVALAMGCALVAKGRYGFIPPRGQHE